MKALIQRHPAPIIVLAALVVTWFVYLPGLGGPLLLDDRPQLGVLLDSADLGAGELLADYAVSTSGPRGRPVAMVSFIADTLAFGNDTWWWKHTNVVIHLLAGLLVFALQVLLISRASEPRLLSEALLVSIADAGWVLNSVEARLLCSRGVTEDGLCT